MSNELPWDEFGQLNPNFRAPKATLVEAHDFVPDGYIKAQAAPKGMQHFRPQGLLGGVNFGAGLVEFPTGYGRPKYKGERHMGDGEQKNSYAPKVQRTAPSALADMSQALATLKAPDNLVDLKAKAMHVPDTLNIQQVGIDDPQGKVREGKPKPRLKAHARKAKEPKG